MLAVTHAQSAANQSAAAPSPWKWQNYGPFSLRWQICVMATNTASLTSNKKLLSPYRLYALTCRAVQISRGVRGMSGRSWAVWVREALFCSYNHPGVPMEQISHTQQEQSEKLTVRKVCSSLRKVVKLQEPKPDCPDSEEAHLQSLCGALVDLWAQPFYSWLRRHQDHKAYPQLRNQLILLVSQSAQIQDSNLTREGKFRQLAQLLVSSVLSVPDFYCYPAD